MEVDFSLNFPEIRTGWYTAEFSNPSEVKYSIGEIERIQQLFTDAEFLKNAIQYSLAPRYDRNKIKNIINTFLIISNLTKTPIKSACLKLLLQWYFGYVSNRYRSRINIDEVLVFDLTGEDAKVYTKLSSMADQ